MGLVNQKNVIPCGCLPEKPLQIDMGVEEIVVITDDHIREQAGVQAHLKGTDPMPLRVGQNPPPVEALLRDQQVEDSIIDTVIMPSGIGAMLRIALRFLHKAYFVLGSQYN